LVLLSGGDDGETIKNKNKIYKNKNIINYK
jgi:hypothetical protein